MLKHLWWILTLAGLVLVVALLTSASDETMNPTDRDILLTIASGVLSGVVIGGIVWATQLAREIDEVRRLQRLELARQLRGVHTRIKSAKARMESAETVRTYGIEARGELIPALHELRGVREDVHTWKPASKTSLNYIDGRLETVDRYLQALVSEYTDHYTVFSHMSVDTGWPELLASKNMTVTSALMDDRFKDDQGKHYENFAKPLKDARTRLLT